MKQMKSSFFGDGILKLYIFVKIIYMNSTASKRKLIDLREPVFAVLSMQARQEGVSLKKYIEKLLEAEAERRRPAIPDDVTDPRILSLVGIAKNGLSAAAEDDERLQYILSK